MDPKRHERLSIVAPLAVRVEPDADVAQFAVAVVATFNEIVAALAPIVGGAGVAALYRRSLHLASRRHAWLAGADDETQHTLMSFEGLRGALERQSLTDVAGGGHHLLQTFRDLLASLIGAALTGQLLGPVWANPPAPPAPPAQDTSS